MNGIFSGVLTAGFVCGVAAAAVAAPNGIWISRDELRALPMAGPAWQELRRVASQPLLDPSLANQDDPSNTVVLAKALVAARTGNEALCTDVRFAILGIMGTEEGGRTLALGRKLVAYVVAADLVGLGPAEDARFRSWLGRVRDETLDGKTLRTTHEDRPNNWGTHAGASRAAIAVYLDDRVELARVAAVFRGWLGDRSAYAGFKYGDLAWQADPSLPVGINPSGAMRDGHSIDGVLPDDQRRAGGFQWPPPQENYVYEALQGAVVEAEILSRNGYPYVWEWQDRALLRAYAWLHTVALYPAAGDDRWQLPVIDRHYGSHFWDGTLTTPGKNMGFTDWTHSTRLR